MEEIDILKINDDDGPTHPVLTLHIVSWVKPQHIIFNILHTFTYIFNILHTLHTLHNI